MDCSIASENTVAQALPPQVSPNAAPAAAPGPFSYVALVLAWCVPGLGHILIGQRARGIVFMVAIHGLFAGGLLLGGIRALNPVEQPIWTYTQFLAGWPMVIGNRVEKAKEKELELLQDEYSVGGKRPEVGDDTLRQKREKYGQEFTAEHPLFSYHPKIQDIGSVYCGIAGMLNLLVMFDVLLRITGTTRDTPVEKTPRAASGGGATKAGGAA